MLGILTFLKKQDGSPWELGGFLAWSGRLGREDSRTTSRAKIYAYNFARDLAPAAPSTSYWPKFGEGHD
jgi:hypothetical protein